MLPKGKLYPGERPHVAAKREVLEETGHEVSVHEFLGSMSYPVDSKIKIVQFWHMRTIGGPVRELNRDVKAVKWLPLKEAIDTLSRAHEKVFLANVGPVVVKAAKQAVRNKQAVRKVAKQSRPQERQAAGSPRARGAHAGGASDFRRRPEDARQSVREGDRRLDRAHHDAALDAPDGLSARASTLRSRRFDHLVRHLSLGEIVVDDLAKIEREVGDEVDAGDDLEYRQVGQRRQRMGMQFERGRAGPGALQAMSPRR